MLVGHTYRVLYITRPSHNLKNVKICTERPPRAIIDDLARKVPVQSSAQALDTLFGCIETCRYESLLGFVHSFVKLCSIVPLEGSTLSSKGFKFTYVAVNWGDGCPITVATCTHHHRLDMTWNDDRKRKVSRIFFHA